MLGCVKGFNMEPIRKEGNMIKMIDELGNVMDFDEVIQLLELDDDDVKLVYMVCGKCNRKVFTTYNRVCKKCFTDK